MLRFETDKGEYTISADVFNTIAGAAATNCFGVKGMAMRSVTDGLVHLLRREAMSKGIYVDFFEDKTIAISLRIIVDHGVNIPALSSSIMNEVRYVVETLTGVSVRAVNVFVDSVVPG